MPLLKVDNLTTTFRTKRGVIRAVDDVSFEIEANDQVALVGESGAGKSVTGLSILQLVERPGHVSEESTIRWKGENLQEKSDAEMDNIRGNEIAWIPQDPLSGLNPTETIGKQICETMRIHDFASEDEIHERAISLLQEVGIPDAENRLTDYPSQFSGGMRQRVLIAIALSCEPDLIIADEPTTALDVLVQMQLIQLLRELSEEYGMSVLLITHDLGLVAEIAAQVMVMYAGEIVERSDAVSLFDNPLHPYTEQLMQCSPSISRAERLNTIPGSVPDGANYPSGCRFHPRCPKAKEECSEINPSLRRQPGNEEVACVLYENHDK